MLEWLLLLRRLWRGGRLLQILMMRGYITGGRHHLRRKMLLWIVWMLPM
jgi:hypothetical protein